MPGVTRVQVEDMLDKIMRTSYAYVIEQLQFVTAVSRVQVEDMLDKIMRTSHAYVTIPSEFQVTKPSFRTPKPETRNTKPQVHTKPGAPTSIGYIR